MEAATKRLPPGIPDWRRSPIGGPDGGEILPERGAPAARRR